MFQKFRIVLRMRTESNVLSRIIQDFASTQTQTRYKLTIKEEFRIRNYQKLHVKRNIFGTFENFNTENLI